MGTEAGESVSCLSRFNGETLTHCTPSERYLLTRSLDTQKLTCPNICSVFQTLPEILSECLPFCVNAAAAELQRHEHTCKGFWMAGRSACEIIHVIIHIIHQQSHESFILMIIRKKCKNRLDTLISDWSSITHEPESDDCSDTERSSVSWSIAQL